ncbi:MAG: PAS domain-containing protein [Actinobacteria bacterium]|nr:PAS domain-containing protein [Actinomycetota bacterium]
MRDFSYALRPARSEDGSIVAAVATIRDTTEQKRAAEEVRESRRQVLDILESITDGFFALDNLWRFTYVNYRAQRLLRRRKEELFFKNIWEVLPETASSIFYREYHRAKEEMVPVTFEAFYPPLNRWFEVHAYPYKNGLSVYLSDVTERIRAEEKLRENEERLRTIVDNTTAHIYIKDIEGRISSLTVSRNGF